MGIHASGHRGSAASDSHEASFHQKTAEELFSRDQAMLLRFLARRNHLLATWAAEMMHLTPKKLIPIEKVLSVPVLKRWMKRASFPD